MTASLTRPHFLPKLPNLGLAGMADNLIGPVLASAVFTAAYLSWRPVEILFTVSDGLFCLVFALAVLARRLPLYPFAGLTPFWLLCLTGVLGGMLIGSIAHGDPLRWIVLAVQYVFSFMVLPMLLIGHRPQRTDTLMKALAAGVVCMELFGAVVYVWIGGTPTADFRLGIDFISGSGRLGGFLGDPNWNAAAICMALPFIFYLRARRRIGFLTAGFGLAILCVGLLLSASVSGLMSAVMSAGLFLLISGIRLPIKTITVVVAAGAMLIATYGLPRAFENRVAPAISNADVTEAGTFDGRVELIELAWGMLEHTQIVGLGADQFREVAFHNAPVHQLFLLLWTEGGLMSLICWTALLSVLIIGIVRAMPHDQFAAALGAAVLSTFLFYTSANPHMYARFWIAPLLLAMGPVFAVASGAYRNNGLDVLRRPVRRRALAGAAS